MWSCARYDLGLGDEDFYSLTPRQFDALLRRHRNHVEANELLFAQLTSWVANTGFRSTEKPTHPRDFMPSQWAKHPKPKRPRMTKKRRQDIADGLRMMFAVR